MSHSSSSNLDLTVSYTSRVGVRTIFQPVLAYTQQPFLVQITHCLARSRNPSVNSPASAAARARSNRLSVRRITSADVTIADHQPARRCRHSATVLLLLLARTLLARGCSCQHCCIARPVAPPSSHRRPVMNGSATETSRRWSPVSPPMLFVCVRSSRQSFSATLSLSFSMFRCGAPQTHHHFSCNYTTSGSTAYRSVSKLLLLRLRLAVLVAAALRPIAE